MCLWNVSICVLRSWRARFSYLYEGLLNGLGGWNLVDAWTKTKYFERYKEFWHATYRKCTVKCGKLEKTAGDIGIQPYLLPVFRACVVLGSFLLLWGGWICPNYLRVQGSQKGWAGFCCLHCTICFPCIGSTLCVKRDFGCRTAPKWYSSLLLPIMHQVLFCDLCLTLRGWNGGASSEVQFYDVRWVING